jgi:hypothetical protein
VLLRAAAECLAERHSRMGYEEKRRRGLRGVRVCGFEQNSTILVAVTHAVI